MKFFSIISKHKDGLDITDGGSLMNIIIMDSYRAPVITGAVQDM